MDVFDLFATLTLDDSQYQDKLKNASESGKSFGEFLKNGLATAAKVGAVALGAAATAVGFMTKAAVSGFAEQEQLIGGVQKLYGNMGMSVEEYAKSVGKSVDDAKGEWQKLENAQNTVLSNAKNAYKTAGMSANQYMETATSFSAALINSLGGDTQKAAEQTDVAMRAISDNFNTFGGDIGSIQGAFQGFAKQNYTMLDNLKLGYGGTKSEMERLISDANEYAKATGQAADLSIDSFSDIVTAIDLVQQKQNIAGTTAREAASTVEGSLNMLRGAWTNLLSGLGDADADIGQLVDNVVSSAETVMTNVMPVVENALTGIAQLIDRLAPMIAEKLPGLIQTILPPLISAAMTLVLGLVQALPTIITALIAAIPTIIDAIVAMDWAGFGTQILQAFIDGFTSVLGMLGITGDMTMEEILDSITSKLGEILSKGAEIIANLANGLISAAPQVLTAIGSIIARLIIYLVSRLPAFLSKGMEIVGKIGSGISQGASTAISAMASGMAKVVGKITEKLSDFQSKGRDIIGRVASGITSAISKAVNAIVSGINQMKSKFTSTNWASVGSEIMSGIANGIRNGLSGALSAMASAASNLLAKAKNALKIKSPSKVFRDQVGKMIGAGIQYGILDMIPAVNSAMDEMEDELSGGLGGVDFGTDSVVTRLDDGGSGLGNSSNVVNNWNINVDGAENPELFANRMVNELMMKVRMA